MHYQLFIPDDGTVRDIPLAQRLADVGLADHADNAMPQRIQSGPHDLPGRLIGWLSTAAGNTRLEYKPDEQTWIRSAPIDGREAGAYWLGIWNDSPPNESELRRAYTQSGERVRFGDQTWKLPTIGSVDSYAAFNDDGSMRWVPVREFAWIIDEAAKMRDEWLTSYGDRDLRFRVDPSECVLWIVRLLRVNYHFVPECGEYLQMFRAEAVADAVLKSLGLERTEEVS